MSGKRRTSSTEATTAPAERAARAAAEATAAEARHDDAAANEAWRRYRLIRDGQRDPDELLAEGIEFSVIALALSREE